MQIYSIRVFPQKSQIAEEVRKKKPKPLNYDKSSNRVNGSFGNAQLMFLCTASHHFSQPKVNRIFKIKKPVQE